MLKIYPRGPKVQCCLGVQHGVHHVVTSQFGQHGKDSCYNIMMFYDAFLGSVRLSNAAFYAMFYSIRFVV